MKTKSIRKKLGRWKGIVLDQWPYQREMARMPEKRAAFRRLLDKLPPIPVKAGDEIEVHMLCGQRDFDMGIWASWSLFRFLDGRGRLFVHSDGSLDKAAEDQWRSKIESLVVVGRDDAKRRVKEELEDQSPLLHQWSLRNLPGIQLIDTHFFGTAKSFLVLDTDVLCFRRPDVLLDKLADPSGPFAWCKDLCEAYSADPELIREITGVSLPSRVNHGIFVNPRLTAGDFARLEEKLRMFRDDGRIDLNHYWSSQTYVAVIAGMKGNAARLPDAYSIRNGKGADDEIIRHYVGVPRIRFRYFTEGLPRILAQLEA